MNMTNNFKKATVVIGLAVTLTFVIVNPPLLKGLYSKASTQLGGSMMTPMTEAAGQGSTHGNAAMTEPGAKASGSIIKDPNTPVSSDNRTGNPTAGSGKGQSIEGSGPLTGAGPIYRPGTVEEAVKYMGEDFRQPEYIPSGYERVLTQVPEDMSKKGMEIMLGYKKEIQLYTIRLKKNAPSYEYFTGGKEIDINGVKAQLFAGKLHAGNQELSSDFTRLQWHYKEVLYTLEGQISEEEALKVARSTK